MLTTGQVLGGGPYFTARNVRAVRVRENIGPSSHGTWRNGAQKEGHTSPRLGAEPGLDASFGASPPQAFPSVMASSQAAYQGAEAHVVHGYPPPPVNPVI